MSSTVNRSIQYPTTRRDDTVDTSSTGIPVADPYRWMEVSSKKADDQQSESKAQDEKDLESWIDQQNIAFESYFSQDSDKQLRQQIKSQLEQLYNFEKFSCPFKRGDRYFYFHNTGLQNQHVLYSQLGLDHPATVFIDPNSWSSDGTASLSTSKFSENGEWLAYGISRSGSDWSRIEIKNVLTQEILPERLNWIKFSSIAWTHDAKGFYYCRFPGDDNMTESAGTEGDSALNQKVYYHRLNTPQSEDILVLEDNDHPTWLFGAEVSDDGRYLVISVSESCDPKNLLYLCDLQQSTGIDGTPLVVNKLIDQFEAEYSYITNENTRFYFKTNLNAPRSKLVSIDIADQSPPKDRWVQVLPERTDVLNYISVVNGTKLVVVYLRDAKEQMSVFDLDRPNEQGDVSATEMEIALPTIGSVTGLSGRKKDSEMFYSFSSFTYPGTIFHYDFSSGSSRVFREIKIEGFEPSRYHTEQVFYHSKDGTRIPMFIIHPVGLERNGENLAYLYGYGGFSISLTPSFSAFRCVLMEHTGGVIAIPNLRGGGEYGEEWHEQGTLERKQNVFDDFIAAAEYLIEHKYTQSSKIAISGGSNGGLLVAACITQRPTLFGAAICQVGVLDMLRFHKFTIGHFWCSDYGNADNAEHFPFLYKYSPLHNIRKGEPYPATLITTADHDDRVVPLHSYKFVATLQHELANEAIQTNPLLIRVDTKAGHGGGKPTSKLIEEVADIYAFITLALGVAWK